MPLLVLGAGLMMQPPMGEHGGSWVPWVIFAWPWLSRGLMLLNSLGANCGLLDMVRHVWLAGFANCRKLLTGFGESDHCYSM